MAIFLEKGFERASLAAIVRRSGGSLATLYDLFGSKEGLFEAMVAERCAAIITPMGGAAVPTRDPCTTLAEIAHRFMEVLLAPEVQGLWRMLMAEGIKFPRLPQIYFRNGPDVLRDRIAAYLADLHARGIAIVPDPTTAAVAFCMLVHGDLYYRVVTGMRPVPDAAELAAHIQRHVALFWRTIQPPADPAGFHGSDAGVSRL